MVPGGGMVLRLQLLVALACCLAAEGLRKVIDASEVEDSEASADNPGYDADSLDDMVTDWDAAEAVQEVQPFSVPPPVSRATWCSAPAVLDPKTVTFANNRTRNYPIGMRWHYGAHHKSGTNLLRELAIEHARLLEMESCLSHGKYGWNPQDCARTLRPSAKVWFWCNLSVEVLRDVNKDRPEEKDYWGDYRDTDSRFAKDRKESGMWRGVHIIRDPIGMVASGYIYHMQSDDTPLSLLPMRNMSEMDGLAMEAKFVISQHGPVMVRTYTDAPDWVMHVRFESLTKSSEEYDKTVAAIYDHMLGSIYTEQERKTLIERARKHDLRRTHEDAKNGHVARYILREQIRQKVLEIPHELMVELKKMRTALGYCKDISGQDMRTC